MFKSDASCTGLLMSKSVSITLSHLAFIHALICQTQPSVKTLWHFLLKTGGCKQTWRGVG